MLTRKCLLNQSSLAVSHFCCAHCNHIHYTMYVLYAYILDVTLSSAHNRSISTVPANEMLKSAQLALGLCKRLLKSPVFTSFYFFLLLNTWLVFVFVLTQLSLILYFFFLKLIPFGGFAYLCSFIRVFLDVEFIVAVAIDLFCFVFVSKFFFFSIDCTLELCDYSIYLLEVCAHSIAKFAVLVSLHVRKRASECQCMLVYWSWSTSLPILTNENKWMT